MALSQAQSPEQLISDISQEIEAQILNLSERQQQSLQERDEEIARRDEEERERVAALQQLRVRILRRASRGLSQLIALSSKPEMIQMIHKGLKLREMNFAFYYALRPSGNAWDKGPEHGPGNRMAVIEFTPDAIIFRAGSEAVPFSNVNLELRHDAPPAEQEALLSRLIASVKYGTNGRRALNWHQRVDEWDPEELLMYVLAECSEPKICMHYLGIALKHFRTETISD